MSPKEILTDPGRSVNEPNAWMLSRVCRRRSRAGSIGPEQKGPLPEAIAPSGRVMPRERCRYLGDERGVRSYLERHISYSPRITLRSPLRGSLALLSQRQGRA